MPSRLIIAFTLSLALHGGLLFSGVQGQASPPLRPPLLAALRPPPEPAQKEIAPPDIDPLLKNTIDEEMKTPEEAKPRPAPVRERPKATDEQTPSRQEMQTVRRKLSKYVFYPEEARRLGVEGTVDLHVVLSEDGRVEDVRVLTSSGHPILDNAAIKGFYAVGRFPGRSGKWSYTFRLE